MDVNRKIVTITMFKQYREWLIGLKTKDDMRQLRELTK